MANVFTLIDIQSINKKYVIEWNINFMKVPKPEYLFEKEIAD